MRLNRRTTRRIQPIALDQEGTILSSAANLALAEPWKDLWNGDLSLTETIIAEDFVAHAAPLTGTGPDQIRGREALNGWISGIHAILPDLAFVIEVGPITDGQHMVVRWKARGTYRGGFPGAAPEAVGRKVIFTGTDTLRIARGQLAEYWANADSLLFYQQLGIREVPAQR
jgi:predicted ester cyclase